MLLWIPLTLAAPGEIPVQGSLLDEFGAPLTGAYTVTFRLRGQSGSGTDTWSETQVVQFQSGAFSTQLGLSGTLDLDWFHTHTGPALTLEIGAAGESDPTPIAWTPLAASAARAHHADLADIATNADNADNADMLGGQSPAAYTYATGVGLSRAGNTFAVDTTSSALTGLFGVGAGLSKTGTTFALDTTSPALTGLFGAGAGLSKNGTTFAVDPASSVLTGLYGAGSGLTKTGTTFAVDPASSALTGAFVTPSRTGELQFALAGGNELAATHDGVSTKFTSFVVTSASNGGDGTPLTVFDQDLTTETWRLVLEGAFYNNHQGGSLPQMPTFIELSSTKNTLAVGSTSLRFFRDAPSNRLRVLTNNAVAASRAVGFRGTLKLYPQRTGVAGTSSASFADGVAVGGALTVAGTLNATGAVTLAGDLNVAGYQDMTAKGTLGQMMAQAACTAMNATGNWTFAVPRTCGAGQPDCTAVCNSVYESQVNRQLICYDSLHVYGNQPARADATLGMKILKYGSCGGSCGPNFCCCR